MKTPITPIRLPLELKEQAKYEAKRGNLTLSQYIFKAIRYYIHAAKHFKS